MPVAVPDHLAGRHPVLLPGVLRVRPEDRVLGVLGPLQAVLAGGVTDGVGLVLLAAGIPHAVQLAPDRRTGRAGTSPPPSPRLLRRQHRLVAQPLPGLAVLAGGVADPGFAPGLAGVPHAVQAAVLEDDGAVDLILPAGLLVGAKDDGRLAPGQAVLALGQGDALSSDARRTTCGTCRPPAARDTSKQVPSEPPRTGFFSYLTHPAVVSTSGVWARRPRRRGQGATTRPAGNSSWGTSGSRRKWFFACDTPRRHVGPPPILGSSAQRAFHSAAPPPSSPLLPRGPRLRRSPGGSGLVWQFSRPHAEDVARAGACHHARFPAAASSPSRPRLHSRRTQEAMQTIARMLFVGLLAGTGFAPSQPGRPPAAERARIDLAGVTLAPAGHGLGAEPRARNRSRRRPSRPCRPRTRGRTRAREARRPRAGLFSWEAACPTNA